MKRTVTGTEHLKNIRQQLNEGIKPPTETVRNLLGWYGVTRRGIRITNKILDDLKKFNLETTPTFENAYIADEVKFIDTKDAVTPNKGETDPTLRIHRLDAANNSPIKIKPQESITKAITTMLANDFSQLPVMTTDREVKGIVSWQSIGSRLSLEINGKFVDDFIDPVEVVDYQSSLNAAITIISNDGCVLVKNINKKICGIVTAADLTLEYQKLSQPFLLIGEIENFIRKLIRGRFSNRELNKVRMRKGESNFTGVSDLSFGEYRALIENEDNWQKLELQLDRVAFIKSLDQVREIRNDIMHFSPDDLLDADLAKLQYFADFLRTLHRIGALEN